MIFMIELKEPDLELIDHFFQKNESDYFFDYFSKVLNWKQESIFLFGKKQVQPRLTALYGDASYAYSGITMHPEPWNAELLKVKHKLEIHCGTTFNAVLCNLYRNGADSMGWHSDDEKELGSNPLIASVSFGAARKFQMKHKTDTSISIINTELTNGSLLVMKGSTQHFWKHAVPKQKYVTEPRINLTFRKII